MRTSRFNKNFNIISNNIRLYIYQLLQEQLCAKLLLFGITLYKVNIYKIENNKRNVKNFELWGISKVFNIPIEALLKIKE